MIKFQQIQALTSHFEGFWSMVQMSKSRFHVKTFLPVRLLEWTPPEVRRRPPSQSSSWESCFPEIFASISRKNFKHETISWKIDFSSTKVVFTNYFESKWHEAPISFQVINICLHQPEPWERAEKFKAFCFQIFNRIFEVKDVKFWILAILRLKNFKIRIFKAKTYEF